MTHVPRDTATATTTLVTTTATTTKPPETTTTTTATTTKPAASPPVESFSGGEDHVVATGTPTAGTPPTRAAQLQAILHNNQVADDTRVNWRPNIGPLPIDAPINPRTITQTEAQLLDQLGFQRGISGLLQFQEITSNDRDNLGLAYRTADEYFPQRDASGGFVPGGEDGHNDAFRHAYWNALMTSRFGEGFAEAFGTAHEGVPGNPADREAMDLHNNALGRRIALENPGASDEELARLVFEAVNNGDAVVIDRSGELKFSDQVAVGHTGRADDLPVKGVVTPPEWTES